MMRHDFISYVEKVELKVQAKQKAPLTGPEKGRGVTSTQ